MLVRPFSRFSLASVPEPLLHGNQGGAGVSKCPSPSSTFQGPDTLPYGLHNYGLCSHNFLVVGPLISPTTGREGVLHRCGTERLSDLPTGTRLRSGRQDLNSGMTSVVELFTVRSSAAAGPL